MHNFTNEIVNSNKTEIRTSPISGKGCFANERIAPGEYIFTLSGEPVQTDPNVANICAKYGISTDDPLQIGDSLFLICNHESKTINHSCNPNAGLRNKSDLYAIREIRQGEEITYDYSTTSGSNDPWTMKCGCNAEICRKVVGNVLTIPLTIIARYASLNILPDFIKNQLKNAGVESFS